MCSPEGAGSVLHVREDDGQYRPAREEEVLQQAKELLSQRVRRGESISSSGALRDYLRLQLGALEHEVFAVVFLDARHRLLALKEMFRGTVSQASVYPREIAKEALALGASAVILAHNHPSGSLEPSGADRSLTRMLQATLELIDVRVLDHLIVADAEVVSFLDRRLL
jgi:DNA repair protein RadC